ncbi:hypothetical protein [Brotaphodocola sp.]|uniref:hypothetical protein n=1 Tax=Brotaphodocola sp. TaxID=3073577 RepID=UPI003D7CF52E
MNTIVYDGVLYNKDKLDAYGVTIETLRNTPDIAEFFRVKDVSGGKLYLDYNLQDDEVIHDVTGRFRYVKELEWFDDPTVLRIIAEVDGVEYVTGEIFKHPDFGTLTSDNLSGGCHTVILAYEGSTDGLALPLSWLDENCFKVLGSVSVKSDVVFDADTMPQLREWECKFISRRTGNVIDSYDSYYTELERFTLSQEEHTWF